MHKNDTTFLIGIIAIISLVSFTISFFPGYTVEDILNKSFGTGEESIQKYVTVTESNNGSLTRSNDKILQFKKAPEFQKIEGSINTNDSTPITMDSLKGNVVLVNFWTYSCINTLRTLPYLLDWDTKYSDNGLVIVGVHTPEFEFEKNTENVQSAVQRYGVKYPVLQDNLYGTWNAYGNNYWPRMYLVDSQGYIRYDKMGEGDYDLTEKVIQSLLNERNNPYKDVKNVNLNNTFPYDYNDNTQNNNKSSINSFLAQSIDFSKIKTPELYFGNQSTRSALGNPEGIQPGQTINYSLSLPSSSLLTSKSGIKPSTIYLEGLWKSNPDNVELQSNTGRILLNYSAKSVNLVIGVHNGDKSQSQSQSHVTVYEDDSLISDNSKGIDVGNNGNFIVDEPRLYNIVNHASYDDSNHSLLIDIKGKGLRAYVFTFG